MVRGVRSPAGVAAWIPGIVAVVIMAACGGKQATRSGPAPSSARRPAAPPVERAPGVHHPLRRGQTLYALSRAYGVPVSTIMEANGITDPSSIPADTLILIPGATRLLEIPTLEGLWLDWPLKGAITSRFGPRGRGHHTGIDIQGRPGQAITAAADGRVQFAGRAGRYGKTVILDHGNHYATRYAHASRLLVKEGERVRRGQEIAVVGSTGNATGIHLHFEVLWKGRRLDPIQHLPR